MKDAEVIVIGSGLSGMTAAFRLAQAGRRVLVLEARDVLGGRTSSWTQDGMPVESGLHKFLGIYRVLPRLLKDAGVDTDKMLTWVDAVEMHADDARSALFPAAPYRRPLATLRGLLGNSHYVPWRDKLRLG